MASKVVQKGATSLARDGSLCFESTPKRFLPLSVRLGDLTGGQASKKHLEQNQ